MNLSVQLQIFFHALKVKCFLRLSLKRLFLIENRIIVNSHILGARHSQGTVILGPESVRIGEVKGTERYHSIIGSSGLCMVVDLSLKM